MLTDDQGLDTLNLVQAERWREVLSHEKGMIALVAFRQADDGYPLLARSAEEISDDHGMRIEFVERATLVDEDARNRTFERQMASLLERDPCVVVIDVVQTPDIMRGALALADAGHKVLVGIRARSVRTAFRHLQELGIDSADFARVRGVAAVHVLPGADGRGVTIADIRHYQTAMVARSSFDYGLDEEDEMAAIVADALVRVDQGAVAMETVEATYPARLVASEVRKAAGKARWNSMRA